MHVRHSLPGFLSGCAFGTFGVFVVGLLDMLYPAFSPAFSVLLMPGRIFASIIIAGDASDSVILSLYLLTGVFYGMCGVLLQNAVEAFHMHHRRRYH